MKILLPAMLALATLATGFCQTTADIAKNPFAHEKSIVAIPSSGGTLKQTSGSTWEYIIYSSPRTMVIEISDPAAADFEKRKAPLFCQIREITERRVYLTALGNTKNTAMGGAVEYSWKR